MKPHKLCHIKTKLGRFCDIIVIYRIFSNQNHQNTALFRGGFYIIMQFV